MKAIKFKEVNADYGKSQDGYNTLPSFCSDDGIVTSCYKLSLRDLLKVVFTRKIWVSIMTFKKPLQPQLLSVDKKDFIIHDK